ncbi:cobalamin biosynthesis protein CbiA [bacterium]|nr:cobalamin biosynthesis protein CbiA [bacterium]
MAELQTIQAKVIIIVGHFGSGKTEVAVNFVRFLAEQGRTDLKLVDLDVVNPYFRSREARQALEALGIEVIAPVNEDFYNESPIISPQIKTELIARQSTVILDVGGDDLGARVLSSLNDAFIEGEYELWVVLNKNRPFTSDPAGCLKMIKEIEAASRLKVTGLISNTHLINETTLDIIREGFYLVKKVTEETGIPVKFVTADYSLQAQIQVHDFPVPVLFLERLMLKPWEVMSGLKIKRTRSGL